MALTDADKATIAEIVAEALKAQPKTARASSTATAFPLAKTHPCTATKPCYRMSRTEEGAAVHLAADAPRNAVGHQPIRDKAAAARAALPKKQRRAR